MIFDCSEFGQEYYPISRSIRFERGKRCSQDLTASYRLPCLDQGVPINSCSIDGWQERLIKPCREDEIVPLFNFPDPVDDYFPLEWLPSNTIFEKLYSSGRLQTDYMCWGFSNPPPFIAELVTTPEQASTDFGNSGRDAEFTADEDESKIFVTSPGTTATKFEPTKKHPVCDLAFMIGNTSGKWAWKSMIDIVGGTGPYDSGEDDVGLGGLTNFPAFDVSTGNCFSFVNFEIWRAFAGIDQGFNWASDFGIFTKDNCPEGERTTEECKVHLQECRSDGSCSTLRNAFEPDLSWPGSAFEFPGSKLESTKVRMKAPGILRLDGDFRDSDEQLSTWNFDIDDGYDGSLVKAEDPCTVQTDGTFDTFDFFGGDVKNDGTCNAFLFQYQFLPHGEDDYETNFRKLGSRRRLLMQTRYNSKDQFVSGNEATLQCPRGRHLYIEHVEFEPCVDRSKYGPEANPLKQGYCSFRAVSPIL